MIKNILQVRLMLFLFLVFGVIPASASPAMNLNDYEKVLSLDVSGAPGRSFSGVTFNSVSKTLYVADDIASGVYEISTDGEFLRSISLSGFEDTEGIAFQSGDYFFFAEERRANLVRAQLPAEGTGPVDYDNSTVLNLGTGWGNTGLEDVAFSAAANTVYAVKEMSPSMMFQINLDEDGDPVDFVENAPFSIEDISGDAAGLCALADGSFLLVNQEENRLIGYSESGEVLSELSLNMTQPEGVAVDESNGRIYVVGEPNEFSVFESSTSPIRPVLPLAASFKACQNNVFPGELIFQYQLPAADFVLLELFDVHGKKLQVLEHKLKSAGTYQKVWKTSGIPPGVYTFKYSAGKIMESIRYVLF